MIVTYISKRKRFFKIYQNISISYHNVQFSTVFHFQLLSLKILFCGNLHIECHLQIFLRNVFLNLFINILNASLYLILTTFSWIKFWNCCVTFFYSVEKVKSCFVFLSNDFKSYCVAGSSNGQVSRIRSSHLRSPSGKNVSKSPWKQCHNS